MELNNKVLVLPNICGVHLDLTGIATPSLAPSLQPFYNTIVQDSAPIPVYTTPSKIRFSETSNDGRDGITFNQTLQLEFPSNDPLRVNRIQDYTKVKYLYITLSTGMVFFFGRNDYFQNTAPKVKVSSNEKKTQITYTCKSWFPSGFTNGSFDFEIPGEFPLNFYNL